MSDWLNGFKTLTLHNINPLNIEVYEGVKKKKKFISMDEKEWRINEDKEGA